MSKAIKNSDLPEGLSVSDLERLKTFAERMVEHAVDELISHRLRVEPLSSDLGRYVAELTDRIIPSTLDGRPSL